MPLFYEDGFTRVSCPKCNCKYFTEKEINSYTEEKDGTYTCTVHEVILVCSDCKEDVKRIPIKVKKENTIIR